MGHAHVVPTIGNRFVIVHSNVEWHMPGGTIEAGEMLDDVIRREVMEEAGATLLTQRLLSGDTLRF